MFRSFRTLVSFVGLPNLEAVFAGVYHVGIESAPEQKVPPAEYLAWPRSRPDLYHYELAKDGRFDALQDRLVVGWTGGARNWVQKFRVNSMPVVELLPAGYVREFPGFLDFTLTFDELRGILKNPAAHRQWHLMLSSVAGVFDVELSPCCVTQTRVSPVPGGCMTHSYSRMVVANREGERRSKHGVGPASSETTNLTAFSGSMAPVRSKESSCCATSFASCSLSPGSASRIC